MSHNWHSLGYSVLCFNKVDKYLKSLVYVFGSSSLSPLLSSTGFCIYDLLSQVVLVVKNLPANVGDVRIVGLIPGLGRSFGRGRAWQPTPVFLPGESLWTEEPGGLQSMGLQRVGHN